MTKNSLIIAGLVLMPFSAHAIVQTVSWNFANNAPTATASATATTSYSETYSGGTNNPTTTVSAYSTTNTNPNNNTFLAGTVVRWSGNGLGAYAPTDDSGSPNHAFDNDGSAQYTTDYPPDGKVDAGQFVFSSAVTLTDITMGWVGCSNINTTGCSGTNTVTQPLSTKDADISVLAFMGSSQPTTIIGKSFAQLIAAGWQFIGNYNINQANSKTNINAGGVSSSYWLVSSYTKCANNIAGQCQTSDPTGLDFGNDYFKIASLGGSFGNNDNGQIPGIPEPSSLFLLAIGAFGIYLNQANKRSPSNASATFSA